MNRLLRATLLVLLLAVSIGVGAIGVHALPICQRMLRVYKQKLAHHKISAATAARWKAWGEAHPNYHPRPKMSPKETEAKLDFACQVPTEDQVTNTLIPPVAPPTLLFPIVPMDLFTAPSQPNIVVRNDLPPSLDTPPSTDEGTSSPFYPSTPTLFGGVPPITSTVPPPVSPVPEPGSLALMITGVGLLLLLMLYRKRQRALPDLFYRSDF